MRRRARHRRDRVDLDDRLDLGRPSRATRSPAMRDDEVERPSCLPPPRCAASAQQRRRGRSDRCCRRRRRRSARARSRTTGAASRRRHRPSAAAIVTARRIARFAVSPRDAIAGRLEHGRSTSRIHGSSPAHQAERRAGRRRRRAARAGRTASGRRAVRSGRPSISATPAIGAGRRCRRDARATARRCRSPRRSHRRSRCAVARGAARASAWRVGQRVAADQRQDPAADRRPQRGRPASATALGRHILDPLDQRQAHRRVGAVEIAEQQASARSATGRRRLPAGSACSARRATTPARAAMPGGSSSSIGRPLSGKRRAGIDAGRHDRGRGGLHHQLLMIVHLVDRERVERRRPPSAQHDQDSRSRSSRRRAAEQLGQDRRPAAGGRGWRERRRRRRLDARRVAAGADDLVDRRARNGEVLAAGADGQRGNDRERQRHAQGDADARAPRWLSIIDAAADPLDIGAHHVHADAAAGNRGDRVGGRQARLEDQVELAARRDIRCDARPRSAAAGERACATSRSRIDAAAVVGDLDQDLVARLARRDASGRPPACPRRARSSGGSMP